jgi:hypothetical protein
MNSEQITLGGFAAVLNSRLAAEARIARAKGFLWTSGGVAIGMVMAGLGISFALYGFSHVHSVSAASEHLANSIKRALETAQFKTTVSGNVSLSPNAELKLAPNQVIALTQSSFLRLDPNSTVRVVGDVKLDIPQPSREQLQLDTKPKSNELPFTTYTIFRNVVHAGGQVVTGWKYDLNDPTRPQGQFCYFRQQVEKGVTVKYTLAINGNPHAQSITASKLKIDLDEALANCIWFSGN